MVSLTSYIYIYILFPCAYTNNISSLKPNRWMQTIDNTGRGEIISVNSYGPAPPVTFFGFCVSNCDVTPYMGGPKLHDNSAECLFEFAKRVTMEQAGNGIVVNWNSGDCEASTFVSEGGLSGTLSPTSSPATSSPTGQPTSVPTGQPTSNPS